MYRHFTALLLALTALTGAGAELPDTLAPLEPDTARVIPEFKRKMETTVFIPKGQIAAGISVSYSQSNQNDYQFLILDGINGDTYSFKVSPLFIYFVKDDLGLGGRFNYSRSLTKLEHAHVTIDSETDYDVDNLYNLSHNYSVTALMRNYISLGRSKRFAFFNEVQLEMGGGQSKIMKGKSEDLTGAYTRNFHLNVGLAPGLCVFLNNNSAMEVNIGILGFGLTDTKQINDRVYVSNLKRQQANFRINLFSISFGMTFYI